MDMVMYKLKNKYYVINSFGQLALVTSSKRIADHYYNSGLAIVQPKESITDVRIQSKADQSN